MIKIFSLLSVLLVLSSFSAYADIPVLSVDESGVEQSSSMSDEDYSQVVLVQADTSAQAAEDHLTAATLETHLSLKGILIGLEAAGNIGIGAFKIGTALNQQFYFEIKK